MQFQGDSIVFEPNISVQIVDYGQTANYGFGQVQVGQTETITVRITNTGPADLNVSELQAPNDPFGSLPVNTADPGDDWLIAPGQTQDFTVTFAPSAVDQFTGQLTIVSNDPDEPAHVLQLNGQGVITRDLDAKGKLTYRDANGNEVKLSLSGGGTGKVYFAGPGDSNVAEIHLDAVGTRCSFSIVSRVITTIGWIRLHTGSLKQIAGSKVDLANGGIRASAGNIDSITLHDTSVCQIEPGSPAKGFALTAHNLGPFTRVTVGSSVQKITAAAWQGGGTLTAPWAGSVDIKGDAKGGIAGNFLADLNLTGQDAEGLSLGKLSAAGEILSDIDLAAAGGMFTCAEWVDGSIDATWVKSIDVKGNRKANLRGDFFADVNLTGTDENGSSLNTLKVAGMAGDDGGERCSVWTSGSIDSVQVGGACHIDFVAGLPPGTMLATATGADFLNPAAEIKSFKIKGWRVPRGQAAPILFDDSSLCGGVIGTVDLLNVAYGNGGASFGVYARDAEQDGEIKQVSCKSTADKNHRWTWKPGDDLADLTDDPGDMEIRLL